ncbi:hypothetical protein [Tahibacter sp.]|uniref:hypothetical protein n=1 Tax=Tahibacter sp. TaxID=2056211 RepID=UPI0028C41F63|nr:hypothetical protein [Tahibacter sp.]
MRLGVEHAACDFLRCGRQEILVACFRGKAGGCCPGAKNAPDLFLDDSPAVRVARECALAWLQNAVRRNLVPVEPVPGFQQRHRVGRNLRQGLIPAHGFDDAPEFVFRDQLRQWLPTVAITDECEKAGLKRSLDAARHFVQTDLQRLLRTGILLADAPSQVDGLELVAAFGAVALQLWKDPRVEDLALASEIAECGTDEEANAVGADRHMVSPVARDRLIGVRQSARDAVVGRLRLA